MPVPNYKIGERSRDGYFIKNILHNTPKTIIFWDDTDTICYEFYDISDEHSSAIEIEFNKILAMQPPDLDKVTIERVDRICFRNFATALEADSIQQGLKYLKPCRQLLKHIKSDASVRIYFIMWAIVYTIIFSMGLYIINDNCLKIDEPISAIIGGCIGACFSVIQRNKSLKIDNLSKNFRILQQVIIRLSWGVFAGTILYFGIKANLLLGIANKDLYTLFIFASVAGFSERFIPDFLNRLSQGKEFNSDEIKNG